MGDLSVVYREAIIRLSGCQQRSCAREGVECLRGHVGRHCSLACDEGDLDFQIVAGLRIRHDLALHECLSPLMASRSGHGGGTG